ncbi:MAG: ATP-binding protein [Dehalococcoidia bacterium]
MQTALDGSYALLSPAEQALFARLSLFAGSFSLDAAAAVAELDHSAGMATAAMLRGLVEKSLVQVDQRYGEARFRLLEMVREYATERLEVAGALEATGRAHAQFYLRMAEATAPALAEQEQEALLDALEIEHDNLRTALRFLGERGDTEQFLRLAAALWRFWNLRGYAAEGVIWLRVALNAGRHVPAGVRMGALLARGSIARIRAEFDLAEAAVNESLTVARELNHQTAIAQSLVALGSLADDREDFAAAEPFHTEALALFRALGDRAGQATSLLNLGNTLHHQQRIAEGRDAYAESLAICRETGDLLGMASGLSNLGMSAVFTADLPRARAYLTESATLYRRLRHRGGLWRVLQNAGNAAYMLGDLRIAEAEYREALAVCREIDDQLGEAWNLSWLAFLLVHRGDYAAAKACAREALPLSRTLGVPVATSTALNALSLAELAVGNLDAAATYAHELLAFHSSRPEPYGRSAARCRLVEIGTARRDFGAVRGELSLGREEVEQEPVPYHLQVFLTDAGHAARLQGDHAEARTYFTRALRSAIVAGFEQHVCDAVAGLTLLAAATKDAAYAARLLGATEMLTDRTGTVFFPAPPL